MKNYWPKSLRQFSNSRNEDVELRAIDGRLPNDMYGHCFMFSGYFKDDNTTPASTYGMLNRFDMCNNKILFSNDIMKTPSYYLEDVITDEKDQYLQGNTMIFSKKFGFAELPSILIFMDKQNKKY